MPGADKSRRRAQLNLLFLLRLRQPPLQLCLAQVRAPRVCQLHVYIVVRFSRRGRSCSAALLRLRLLLLLLFLHVQRDMFVHSVCDANCTKKQLRMLRFCRKSKQLHGHCAPVA